MSKYLYKDVLSSDRWASQCQDCFNGKKNNKIGLPTIPNDDITYQQWVLDKNSNSCCISNSGFHNHKKTKHIQGNRFNSDIEQKDIGITQLDLTMTYSCDYQSEIQSTLWTRTTDTRTLC